MKNLTTDIFVLPLKRVVTLQSAPVVDDICVYKLSVGFVPEPGLATQEALSALKPCSEQGLTRLADLEAFTEDRASAIVRACVRPEGLKEDVLLQVVAPEFVPDCRLKGFAEASDTDATVVAEVFDAFVAGQWVPQQILAPYVGGHMLFDRSGQILPTALHFDYIWGRVVESVYDLDNLVQHLSADPRVSAGNSRHKRPTASDFEQGLHVQDVPCYNVSPGQSKFVEFVFRPTAEDMRRLWAHALEASADYPTTELHRCVFDLDLLGLKAAGIALCPDSYYADTTA